jgi:leucyl-tRNA synthetase
MQRNWIGRSEGVTFRFQLKDRAATSKFSPRASNGFGSLHGLAPDHRLFPL